MTADASTEAFGELNVPARNLLGPGPSNVHPRVYQAMMTPVIGYLDPAFGARPLRRVIQNEIEDRLSEALLEERFHSGDTVRVDVQNDEIILTNVSEPALA